LVDPLDGTKEFINRNDEFTVNIALIHENKSIAGVVYSPVFKELYVGIVGSGAYKLINPDKDCTIEWLAKHGTKLPQAKTSDEFTVVASRTHLDEKTVAFVEDLKKLHPELKMISRGSSFKICMVAEGIADVYPRFGPTMEWDTAAGHAVAKAAGKNIFLPDLKTELTYNKENLLNPHFIVQ
jgi:3'(2'), 5'-bisphosphate nucleotidase